MLISHLFLRQTVFIIIYFLIIGSSLHAQSREQEDAYLEKKNQQIDSLINVGEFEKANYLIRNTLNTFSFRNKSEERKALEFRSIKILYAQGNKEKALELLLKGLDDNKRDPFSPMNIEYANLLAKIFADSQNFDKAIYYNKKALSKARLIKDTVEIIKSYIRLGSFFYAKNEEDSAKIYFRKVTYFPVNEKTETRISNAYNNLGVIAQNNDNFDLAKGYAKKSLEIKLKQKNPIGISYSNVNLGNLYHYDGDFKIAIENYKVAEDYILQDSSKDAMKLKEIIYDNLSVSYDSLGDYKKAYRYLVEASNIEKDLMDDQIAENIAEVEAKYNLAVEEQKTEEEKSKVFRTQVLLGGLSFLTLVILIFGFIFYKNYRLREQNELKQLQNNLQTRIINATIDAKEKERKSIAEILHDSVSALLSSANLHLQASKAQLNSHVPVEINKAQEIVNEASIKIRDLSHELISSVLLKFGLSFAVHDLCEKYSNSELQLISDDNGIKRYNQKFEIKIYNIIEELVNNILKHSKAKNATINLIERNGDKLLIQIIDDGKGFDIKRAKRKDGLGLSHIEARIKIMKGVFNINSKRGEGTSIFISVPIQQPDLVEAV